LSDSSSKSPQSPSTTRAHAFDTSEDSPRAQAATGAAIKSFSELFESCAIALPPALEQALTKMGYSVPTEVQAQAIPVAFEGRDVLGSAQTGTGKTAAFAIPILTAMMNGSKKPALILAPTRELAEQIHAVLEQLTAFAPQIKSCVIIGGSSYHFQTKSLKMNPMFVVGTPGRLIDQLGLGNLKMENFGTLVIDEADRLLDMGFEPQLEQILMHFPRERQTLLFSATIPQEILKLASRYQKRPVRITVGSASQPVDRIEQQMIEVRASDKNETLIREIDKVAGSLIIFVRTKSRVEAVTKVLTQAGHVVTRIHGDRTQRQRGDAIEDFRSGQARILVATDIAARGIDIPHIKYVINYDLPVAAEDYVHRIGRTARAGAKGHAIAFVTPEERLHWAKIYKLMYGKYPVEMERASRFGGGARKGRFTHKTERTAGAFGYKKAAGKSTRDAAGRSGKSTAGGEKVARTKGRGKGGAPAWRGGHHSSAADTPLNRAARRNAANAGKPAYQAPRDMPGDGDDFVISKARPELRAARPSRPRTGAGSGSPAAHGNSSRPQTAQGRNGQATSGPRGANKTSSRPFSR
jgi:ATP-dependent RNA helicase DeaD